MFSSRSNKKELLDGDVSCSDLYRNLDELHVINKWLGGYSISLKAIRKMNLEGKTFVDIGSGGGDMLEQVRKAIHNKHQNVKLVGIDLKQECIAYSQAKQHPSLSFIKDDYQNIANHLENIDVVHACLFSHHLKDSEIIDLIKFCQEHGAILIVNDLHRHPLAYYSIKLLTRLFSSSHLVKNDAPLSVLRGFKKREWKRYFSQSSISEKQYSVRWKWAFRHLIIYDGAV